MKTEKFTGPFRGDFSSLRNMKPSPFHFIQTAICCAILVLAFIPSVNLRAQDIPEAILLADGGQIIHTILREGDVNYARAGRPRGGGNRHQHGEKGCSGKSKGEPKKSTDRPDDHKKDSDRPKGRNDDKKEQPQKKDDHKKDHDHKKAGDSPKCADCKKGPAPQAATKPKSNCPACQKADGGQCEKWQGRPPQPPHANRGNPEEMRARQNEMRKRFEEMRKHGGPWVENRGGPRDQRGQDHPQQDVGKIRGDLERTQKELEHARQSLHMAHKELGDKTLHIKKLEDQVQNFRSQLGRAEPEIPRQQQMKGEQKELAEALQNERRKSEALQNDVNVVQRKAKEAVAKIQAQAERHVAQSHAKMQAELREHADLLRKKMTPEPKGPARRAEPQKSQSKRPDAKSRGTTSRSPRQPEPNKPADPELPSIAPINYGPKSAVNFEERTRVLNEVTALLKKSPAATIKIIGHADDSPYDQVNQDISTNRASFLSSFLRVSGIDSSKISHQGIGNAAPAKDAANNRRVVIEIVK